MKKEEIEQILKNQNELDRKLRVIAGNQDELACLITEEKSKISITSFKK